MQEINSSKLQQVTGGSFFSDQLMGEPTTRLPRDFSRDMPSSDQTDDYISDEPSIELWYLL